MMNDVPLERPKKEETARTQSKQYLEKATPFFSENKKTRSRAEADRNHMESLAFTRNRLDPGRELLKTCVVNTAFDSRRMARVSSGWRSKSSKSIISLQSYIYIDILRYYIYIYMRMPWPRRHPKDHDIQ